MVTTRHNGSTYTPQQNRQMDELKRFEPPGTRVTIKLDGGSMQKPQSLPAGTRVPARDTYTSTANWKSDNTHVTFERRQILHDGTVVAHFYFGPGFTLEVVLPCGKTSKYTYHEGFTIEATYEEVFQKYDVKTAFRPTQPVPCFAKMILHLQSMQSAFKDVELEIEKPQQWATDSPELNCHALQTMLAPTGTYCCTSVNNTGSFNVQYNGCYWVKWNLDTFKIEKILGQQILPPLYWWFGSLTFISSAHLVMIYHIWQYAKGKLLTVLYQERYDLACGSMLPLLMMFMYYKFPNKWMLSAPSWNWVTLVKWVMYFIIGVFSFLFIKDFGTYVAWYMYNVYVPENVRNLAF